MEEIPFANAIPKKNKNPWGLFGTVIGVVTLVLILLFIVRVFMFYRLIQKGELISLPQFKARLTEGKIKKIDTNLQAQLETADDPSLGTSDPLITIVEFADFECPYSREVFPVMREMAAKYKNKIKIIYRDFPLDDVHPRARRAAAAANCAGGQGKYWAMHDKIYQHADALSDAELAGYAEEVGLNLNLFNACLLSSLTSEEIDDDLASGAALGVAGTPTFFFNGKKIEGAIPRGVFDQLLSASLSQK